VAVLDRRCGVPVGECDVYVSVAGGARACEPAADLAVCLALASSLSGRPLSPELVAIGEVGLGGETRRVRGMNKRLAEARRLGFRDALVPVSTDGAPTRVADPGSRLSATAGRGQGPVAMASPRPLSAVAEPTLRQLPAASLSEALSMALSGWAPGKTRPGPPPKLVNVAALREEDSQSF
jgi:hypothetical protein